VLEMLSMITRSHTCVMARPQHDEHCRAHPAIRHSLPSYIVWIASSTFCDAACIRLTSNLMGANKPYARKSRVETATPR